jgi:hypothetical protein
VARGGAGRPYHPAAASRRASSSRQAQAEFYFFPVDRDRLERGRAAPCIVGATREWGIFGPGWVFGPVVALSDNQLQAIHARIARLRGEKPKKV